MPRQETDEEAILLGRIAVHHKFITRDQLQKASRQRGQSDKKLGVIMLEMGMIDEFALGKILALQQRHLKQLEAQRRSQPAGRPTPRARERPPEEAPRRAPVAEAPRRAPARPAPDSDRRQPSSSREGRPAPLRQDVPRTDPAYADEGLEVDLGAPESAPRSQPASPARPSDDRSPAPADPRASHARRARPHEERRGPAPRPSDEVPPSGGTASGGPISDGPTSGGPASGRAPAVAAATGPELEPRNLEPQRTRQVEQLEQMLSHAAKMGASDVHLSPGNPVKMRRFGRLTGMTDKPLSPAATEAVLRGILNPWQERRLDDLGEVDLAYAIPGVGRYRSNVYRQISGLTGVFHYLPEKIPTLTELGLPTAIAKLTGYSQGLILLTGPAGCGKTTTLAALVDIINGDREDHILTIEDPIEYIHRSKSCVVNQRQVGRDTTSFARALRGALREDPDIICIGELRDLETISLALSAAETGHLVLGTLHTGSSIGTITRIVGAFPPTQQSQIRAMMSESLRAIISQRLVPTADGKSQAVALEILYVNNAVGALIRDNRTYQLGSILQTGKSQGMIQLDESLRELVQSGRVRREDALIHCDDPRNLAAG